MSAPSRLSSVRGTYGLGALGAVVGLYLALSWVSTPQLRAAGLVLASLICVQTVMAVAAVRRLEELAAEEAVTLEVARKSPDTYRVVEAGITDAVHTAYATASNALIVLGMLGVAVLLVAFSPEADGSGSAGTAILTFAPRAFSATAYGLWCGVLIAARGQWVVTQMRRQGAGLQVRAPVPATDGLTSLRQAIEQLSGRIDQLSPHTVPTGQLEGEQVSADIRKLLALVSAHVERSAAIHDLQAQAFAKVVTGLGGRGNVSLVAQLAAVGASIERLSGQEAARIEQGASEQVASDALRRSQEELRLALVAQRGGVLEEQAAALRQEAHRLAEAIVETLTDSAVARVRDTLDVAVADFQSRASRAYDDAFQKASDNFAGRLDALVARTANLGREIERVVDQLRATEYAIGGLGAAIQDGGEAFAQKLDELRGDFQQRVAGVYQDAFLRASRELDDRLSGAARTAAGLGSELVGVVETLTTATERVRNLGGALSEEAGLAKSARDAYGEAVAAAERASSRLAAAVAVPLPDAQAPLATSLAEVCDVLRVVLESLHSTLEDLDDRQTRLRRARDILTARFCA